jgi:hypothetical protein
MRPYRLPVSNEITPTEPPKRRGGRAFWIVLATVGLHAAVFGAAFASRAPENTAPKTRVVSVLQGHITELGDFEATGLANARIRN